MYNVPIDPENCEPVYREFEGGWSTEGCTKYEELPEKAKEYLQYIEEFVEVPIKYIGVGADEKDTIIK